MKNILLLLLVFIAQSLWGQSVTQTFKLENEEDILFFYNPFKNKTENDEVGVFISINKPLDKAVAESIYLMTMTVGEATHITPLEVDEHADNLNKTIYKPIYINPNNFREYNLNRANIPSNAELTITFFNPQNAPATPTLTTPPVPNTPQACPCPQPSFVSRANWGCPDGNSPSCSSPSYTTVTHLIVHHEAGSNNATNWAARVLSIWNFHTGTNGWCDIGYNWLIDPNGVIYEGRGGGNNVVGAHFCGNNSNTMGVCFLGDYTSTQPSQAALNALRDLLAWKACNSNLNPTGTATFAPDNTQLPVICGHRDDVISCSTTCPGNQLYNQLPTVRTNVQNQINTCGVQQLADLTLSNPASSSYTLYPGQGINIPITAKNIGGTNSSNLSQLKLYWSTDCTPNLVELAQTFNLISLPPNFEYTLNFSYNVPLGTAIGNYKFVFFIDQNQQTPESNENNNILCINVLVDSIPTSQCNYTINPIQQTVTDVANTASFNIVTAGGCNWTVSESCDWLTVTNTSGMGSDTIMYTYQQNTTNAARTCTLTVAGQTHIVTQTAPLPLDSVIAELPVILENDICNTNGVSLFAVLYSNIDSYTLSITSLTDSFTLTNSTGQFNFGDIPDGQYTATLIVSNTSDADTLVFPNYIEVASPPTDYTIEITPQTTLPPNPTGAGSIYINSNLTNIFLQVYRLPQYTSVGLEGTTVYYLEAGDYLVRVCRLLNDGSFANACCTDSIVTVPFVQSVNENSTLQATLYPNPTNGLVTLQLQKAITGSINVYDALGKLLVTEAINGTTANLNLSGYAAGVYTLSLSTPNGSASRYKVLKW